MKVLEIEYSELGSIQGYKNYKYGLKIQTTEENYQKDFETLVSEVKTKLNLIMIASNPKKEN